MCAKYRNLSFVIQYNCSRLNRITLFTNGDTSFAYLFAVKDAKVLFSISGL